MEAVSQQQISDFAMGYHDIRYNFMICQFGIIEGRGWDISSEDSQESNSLAIGFFTDELSYIWQMPPCLHLSLMQ